MHGEEEAALRSHRSWQLTLVVLDLVEREATQIWWQVIDALVVGNADSTPEGEREVLLDATYANGARDFDALLITVGVGAAKADRQWDASRRGLHAGRHCVPVSMCSREKVTRNEPVAQEHSLVGT